MNSPSRQLQRTTQSNPSSYNTSPSISLFDRAFNDWMSSGISSPISGVSNSSLYEVDNSYIFQAAIAGIQSESLDITVNGNVLTIRGNFHHPEPENAKVIWSSPWTGTFVEQFSLPSDVYSDEAKATYENGILAITMPKAEKTTRIAITNSGNRSGK